MSPPASSTKQPRFPDALANHADRTAVVHRDGVLNYRELAERVADAAARLGAERRLVLLPCAHTVDALVVYLAALSAGHPLLLVPERASAQRSLIAAYDPDVVAEPDGSLTERRALSAHTLHPELALLLSTSGSTGSPKLVRLSRDNLQANAESIAAYLDIRPDDRAATTLPMSYCYGLSVINSHLLCGAGLILTDLSVGDPLFWDVFRDAQGTSLSGVPYTFDLLDRVGFADLRLPHLRYLTQAGGRMPAEQVVRYAELGRREGWDLFVMYGQTEATARMAYLPPDLATTHPEAVGLPVPGGAFRLDPVPDVPTPDVGELVYTGPNVMLGYAEGPADLALGRTVTELRTGDLARRAPDGLYEVVGRRGGFLKLYGLRIDPRRVEDLLARHGRTACCTGDEDDNTLVVAVAGTPAPEADPLRRLVAAEYGLPVRAVHVHVLAELPRLASGKPDLSAVRALPRPAYAEDETPDRLVALYRRVLGRDDVTEDSSFVSLGGDSLSYVEMSLALENELGHLPREWHLLPLRDLRASVPRTGWRARWHSLETGVLLRAVAIVLIVGSHIPLFTVRGGAHVLLAVAGFNLARFHLTSATLRERRRHLWGSALRIAVPSALWIALAALLTDGYHLFQALLLHSLLGRDSNYWFVEVIVYILLALTVLARVPALDRAERRFPFAAPLVLLGAGLVLRYDVLEVRTLLHLPNAIVAFWMFPLGWAAARADTTTKRLLLTFAALLTVPGYFGPDELVRETVIITGLTLLIWARSLLVPRPLDRLAGLLAASTLYIYLTHWQVYPLLADYSPLLALAASLITGVALATTITRLTRRPPNHP
ncbi:AMP-binding protein [Actinocorallia sp. API 0066]|uniref:AMP-binding protein n=1 Tax=Actinocorallia sp. API 0066 TaxID=2896846 RepID=UPI001E5269E0|nr:AMP-binding protein [Actinocorallia sp. API 0066]MCD0448845.1 AMP-binding protein [Actinocorallia sp. API 0066]